MTQADHPDEISLRDLYLVFRNNLWLIALIAILGGGLAFALLRLQPDVYEGESVTLVTPAPVQVQSAQNLTFSPSSNVSFEAYETLARSRPVIEAAVADVPEVAATQSDFAGEVVMLIGPRTPAENVPLSVQHRARHTDPVLAARLANAWAARTLEAVQTSLLASLDPISERTALEVERLRANLERAEEAYRTFQAGDRGRTLDTLLLAVTQQLADAQREAAQLEQQLAADRAALELLSEGPQPGAEAPPATFAGALDVLQTRARAERQATQDAALRSQVESLRQAVARVQDRLDPTRAPPAPFQPRYLSVLQISPGDGLDAEQLGNLGALLPEVGEEETTLEALLAQAERQTRLVRLAGGAARLEQLELHLAGLELRLADIQAEIADLDRRRRTLTRDRDNAQRAFDSVVSLQPVIEYMTVITPANARILNEATVPGQPVAPRVLLGTAVAVILAALLATVFVFLREAVRPPPATPSPSQRPLEQPANRRL